MRLAVPLWPTLAAIPLLAMLVALGLWQLDRAAEKRGLLTEFAERNAGIPEPLVLPTEVPLDWQYRKVRVSGRLDGTRQFLLDNQVSEGRAGYHVLTPLRMVNETRAVLINRGWVAQGVDRSQRPNVSVTAGLVTLDGYIYVPEKGYTLGGLDDGETGWPRVIQYLDFGEMEDRFGGNLAGMTVRLDEASDHGYLRDWQIVTFSPERHLGYAVQWFALALTLVVIYFVVNLRRNQ